MATVRELMAIISFVVCQTLATTSDYTDPESRSALLTATPSQPGTGG
jgi:hypothetical protein